MRVKGPIILRPKKSRPAQQSSARSTRPVPLSPTSPAYTDSRQPISQLYNMASTSIEQSLLFELRSPTTPLETKHQLISSAIATHSSPSLATLSRDWILDTLLRSLKATSSPQADLITAPGWWSLLARVVSDSPAGSASSAPQTVPILSHFVTSYAELGEANAELVRSVVGVWGRLGGVGMRKATADGALEGWAALIRATKVVVERAGDDVGEWDELVVGWSKTLRTVVDPAKAGKKVSCRVR